jgi:hypothetical protein
MTILDVIVQWLAIKETDDQKTREKKKKLLKSYKSKIRFQEMDKSQVRQVGFVKMLLSEPVCHMIIIFRSKATCTSMETAT